MESVLEVYKRSHDPLNPVVCMDETTVQCIKEVRPSIRAKPGQTERYDVEYERNGVAHLMLFYAPFENWRRIQVSDNHAACEWAQGVRRLVQEDYPKAERITLVMDNLNTHTGRTLDAHGLAKPHNQPTCRWWQGPRQFAESFMRGLASLAGKLGAAQIASSKTVEIDTTLLTEYTLG